MCVSLTQLPGHVHLGRFLLIVHHCLLQLRKFNLCIHCVHGLHRTPQHNTKRCKGARKRGDILQVESPHRHTILQYGQLFYSYSHFRVFRPVHTLHTAISNVWMRGLLEYIWCAKLLPVWSIHISTVNGVF